MLHLLFDRLKIWAAKLKRDVFALYLAIRDRRAPVMAKVVAVLVTAYAFSPIDLIPDFIPVLGYLDDVIILPLGIALAIQLIPAAVMQDLRQQAEHQIADRPTSRIAAIIIVLIWIILTALIIRALLLE